MRVYSWFQLPNLWPFNFNSKVPKGWNPINGLPPCPSDVPHPPDASSPPSQGVSTTSMQVTMIVPSTSGLADAFGSMSLSTSPAASAQISPQAQEAVAATSILADSILPINPASSQVLQPASTDAGNILSSQVQQDALVASSNAGVDLPQASSQVQDGTLAASTGATNLVASSQVQDAALPMSTGALAMNSIASVAAQQDSSAMPTVPKSPFQTRQQLRTSCQVLPHMPKC